MADISQLPNEMVSQIWGYMLEPKDVESFALVSKHIYATGKPFVEGHNKLKKKKPSSKPRVTLYVTHLSIGHCLSEWQVSRDDDDGDDDGNDDEGDDDEGDKDDSDDEWPKDGHSPYPVNFKALLFEAIRKSSLVPLDEVSLFTRSISYGEEDAIFAFLSLILPNLNTMTLMTNGSIGDLFKKTIQRIAEAEKMMFLTRLVTVNIVFTPDGNYMDLDWLRAFAALPLVQSIHVSRMGTMKVNDYIDDELYFKPGSYQITELTFTRSGLRPQLLFQLLESIKGLKTFSYVQPDETFCRFEPFWIRAALLANAKHTLQSLKILSPVSRVNNLLGTLRVFTALKELETNVCLLLSTWSEFENWTDLLPTSIEKIDLDTRDDESCITLSIIVEGVVRAKPRRVPHLKALKFRTEPEVGTMQGGRSLVEPLEELCRSVGIGLTFVAT